MREQIVAALQPVLDAFVVQVEQLARERAEQIIRELLQKLDVRGAGSLPPVGSAPEPAVPAEQGSTSSVEQTPAPRKRKPNTCSKCGTVGFTAMTCGTTHNVSASPATATPAIPRASSEASSPATPKPQLVDRKPPPQSALGPTDAQPSKLQPNVPPPGWTVDEDRREENRALSELHRKYR